MTTRIAWFVLFLVSLGANLWFVDHALSYGGGYLHFALLFVLPMLVYQSVIKIIVVRSDDL
jgi:uncharacterized membrane protein